MLCALSIQNVLILSPYMGTETFVQKALPYMEMESICAESVRMLPNPIYVYIKRCSV